MQTIKFQEQTQFHLLDMRLTNHVHKVKKQEETIHVFSSVAFGLKIFTCFYITTIPLHVWILLGFFKLISMFLCRLHLIQFLRIDLHICTAPSILGTTNKLLYQSGPYNHITVNNDAS
jgi:hypothetical protein